MSFANKATTFAALGLLLSGTVALAQAGGGDVPTDAKKQGERTQPGSTGMSKGEASTPSSTENKQTGSGGQPGGAAGRE